VSLGAAFRSVARFLSHGHSDAKSFEMEVEGAGITGRVEGGMRTIPATKIVGSVGRAHNLRSDFFYRTGQAMTARFRSIGKAMEEGKILPPIEVYKAKMRRPDGEREVEKTEYYVVDGHHRVAMAKKLGQDYLDAHVVEYKVSGSDRPTARASGASGAGGASDAGEAGDTGVVETIVNTPPHPSTGTSAPTNLST
jgi:hypothetical protein